MGCSERVAVTTTVLREATTSGAGWSAAWARETHRDEPATMAGDSAAAAARRVGFFMK